MNDPTRHVRLLALCASFVLAGGCVVGNGGDQPPAESQMSLDQLLVTPWDDLSEADRDRLALLTGEMSQVEYDAIYHPERALEIERADPNAWLLGAGSWTKVDVPGAVCSDGSQYKIFVNYAKDVAIRNSNRVIVFFEPGGACWDYESCTGQSGIRGAANPNGIPDNHMSVLALLNPFVSGGSINALISPLIWQGNPVDKTETAEWNKVFLPYCTGDVHAGNRTVVYEDPSGQNAPITYHHKGAVNVEKSLEWIADNFSQPEELMVAGCSAGGTGALTHYNAIRSALSPRAGYLLDDSGPVFSAPGDGNHYPLQQTIKEAWNLDYLMAGYETTMPGYDFATDFGVLNLALAETWPEDRFAITLFKRDQIYSGYSYARFFGLDENDPDDKEQILRLWAEDIANLKSVYASRDNMSYYIPYMRKMIDSHCTTIVDWTGTEIQAEGVDVGDFITDILDGGDVQSFEEGENPDDERVSDILTWLVDLVASK